MVKGVFNTEASGDINTDPILMEIRENQGVKQYVVHEFTGVFGIGSDDIEYYSEEEYNERFADENVRTYDDVVGEYKDLISERYGALQEAKKFIESNTNYKVGHYDIEDMNAMQKRINEINGEWVLTAGGKTAHESNELGNKAYEIGKDIRDIRERFQEIGEDLEDHGEPKPQLIAELSP